MSKEIQVSAETQEFINNLHKEGARMTVNPKPYFFKHELEIDDREYNSVVKFFAKIITFIMPFVGTIYVIGGVVNLYWAYMVYNIYNIGGIIAVITSKWIYCILVYFIILVLLKKLSFESYKYVNEL